MKKMMIAAAMLTFAAPALADDWDFVLINNTGKSIKSVEVSAGGAGNWVANKVDADLKREGGLKVGGKMTVHFDKGASCKYDVKATFADESTAVWSGINVCDNAYVTVRYDNGTPTFKAS